MGDVLEFKITAKVLKRRREKQAEEFTKMLYYITQGFRFPGQDPEVREGFENGDFELD